MLQMISGFLHDHEQGGAKSKEPWSPRGPRMCFHSPHFGEQGTFPMKAELGGGRQGFPFPRRCAPRLPGEPLSRRGDQSGWLGQARPDSTPCFRVRCQQRLAEWNLWPGWGPLGVGGPILCLIQTDRQTEETAVQTGSAGTGDRVTRTGAAGARRQRRDSARRALWDSN